MLHSFLVAFLLQAPVLEAESVISEAEFCLLGLSAQPEELFFVDLSPTCSLAPLSVLVSFRLKTKALVCSCSSRPVLVRGNPPWWRVNVGTTRLGFMESQKQ